MTVTMAARRRRPDPLLADVTLFSLWFVEADRAVHLPGDDGARAVVFWWPS